MLKHIFPFNRLCFPQCISHHQVSRSYIEKAIIKFNPNYENNTLLTENLAKVIYNTKLVELIRKEILENFFSEYYRNLAFSTNRYKESYPKKDKYYMITLYCQLGNRFTKPVYNRSNYKTAYLLPYEKVFFPFGCDNIFEFKPFSFLKMFPFLEFKSDIEESICCNTIFLNSISTKMYIEGKNKLLDYAFDKVSESEYDDGRPFSELVTEFNYYNGYNIQPVIKVINDKVEFI